MRFVMALFDFYQSFFISAFDCVIFGGNFESKPKQAPIKVLNESYFFKIYKPGARDALLFSKSPNG